MLFVRTVIVISQLKAICTSREILPSFRVNNVRKTIVQKILLYDYAYKNCQSRFIIIDTVIISLPGPRAP